MSTLNKCKHVGPRLLALSAGGDRGAVLVGMLHGLYKCKGRDRVDWDQVSGISAGAIVGGLVSQTCLLYTSPSPRDRTRSRMPSSA